MKAITVDMFHERECKGSHRYDAVNGNMAPVNAVYIRKADIDGVAPAKIRVTITERD